MPELGLLVSTRKQSLDVPFDGTTVELQPLGEAQQMEIARALRGDDGARIVDEARRTPGVRDLVTIPLYLTSLLSLPNGQPFPKTKEEILRRFVQAHEQQVDHAEPLKEAVKGLQTEFLSALAVTATLAANTSIPETNARRSVAQMDDWLVRTGSSRSNSKPRTCWMRSSAIMCWCGRASPPDIHSSTSSFRNGMRPRMSSARCSKASATRMRFSYPDADLKAAASAICRSAAPTAMWRTFEHSDDDTSTSCRKTDLERSMTRRADARGGACASE